LPSAAPSSFPTRRSSDLGPVLAHQGHRFVRVQHEVEVPDGKLAGLRVPEPDVLEAETLDNRPGDGDRARRRNDAWLQVEEDKEVDRKSTRLNSSHLGISY